MEANMGEKNCMDEKVSNEMQELLKITRKKNQI